MEASGCPLYFSLYPPAHLLPGLQEYLEDATLLVTSWDEEERWRKISCCQEENNDGGGLRNQLVVGSRKLVFLHSSRSKWCRTRGGRPNSGGTGEMGLLKNNGTGENGWSSIGNEMDTRDVESVDGGALVGLDAFDHYFRPRLESISFLQGRLILSGSFDHIVEQVPGAFSCK